jgi:predicted nucleic acid-binding protein
MIFVDTNYFLRFLRNDIPKQTEEAKKLFFQAADGQIRLITSTIVVFEIYWVLSSFYGYKKMEVVRSLKGVLGLRGVEIEDREVLDEAVDLYEKTNLGLEDAYNLAYAKDRKVGEFRTFDKKLQKMCGSV